MRMCSLQP